ANNASNAQVDAVMQRITYANDRDDLAAGDIVIEYRFNDENGNGAQAQGSGNRLESVKTVTVTIQPQNDLPEAFDNVDSVTEDSGAGEIATGNVITDVHATLKDKDADGAAATAALTVSTIEF